MSQLLIFFGIPCSISNVYLFIEKAGNRRTAKIKIKNKNSKILEKSLQKLEKNLAFENFNKAYRQLKLNKTMWPQELKDREELEGTLYDGLTEEM